MDEYMVELGGYEYAVQATSPEEARQKALLSHVKSVGQQSVQQAEAGAVERSEAPSETMSPWAESAMAGMSGEGGAYADPNATGADILKRGAGMAAMAGAGATGAGMVAAPVATMKGLAGGLLGSAAGSEAGQWVGRRIPVVGGEMAGDVLGTIGGLVGGIGGGSVAPKLGREQLLAMLPGKGGMLGSILGGGERAAATQVAKTVAPEVAAKSADDLAGAATMAERKLAMQEAESAAKVLKDNARADAIKRVADARVEAIMSKASGATPKPGPKAVPAPPKAPPTEGATALKPEPEFIPDEAVSLVAEPLPFKPRPAKGTTTMATNLGGKAKPGPASTPPDQVENALRASVEAGKAKAGAVRGKGTPLLEDALDTASGMHQREATAGMTEAVAARRKAVGSQKVARELGMERHQVQSDAGTITDEALGEVSKLIPEEPWRDIVLKMKAMPPSERFGYVAKSRGAKNMAQLEQLRRDLEILGLMVPIGVASQSE
jgi:hypothetical protein